MHLLQSAAWERTVCCLGALFLLLVMADATAEPKPKETSSARLMVQDGHSNTVIGVAFSPNGKLVLTGGDLTARLWDVRTGKQLHVLDGHTTGVKSVAFSPDGKLVLTGSQDKTARLWDVQTGKQLRSFQGHTDPVLSVAFNPDGKLVLTGSQDQTARLWDVQTGKQLRSFQGHTDPVLSVAFSPNGQYVLTGSQDKTARLWEVQTGKQTLNFEGHTDPVKSVAFSSDGKLVLTGSQDKTARLWDVQTGKQLRSFQGHTDQVLSVAFSPNGQYVLTGSGDMTARLWEVQTGKQIRSLQGNTTQVFSVAFSPDGKLLLTGSGRTARLWDVQTGKQTHALQGHTARVHAVTFSPNGKLLLTGWDNTARLWDVQTGKQIRNLQGHTDQVLSVAFSPNGQYVLTGSQDKTARLWDVQTGKQIRSFQGHTDPVLSVAFSPNGQYVLTGSGDMTARLWEVQTGKQTLNFEGHTDPVKSVAFSPDGKLVLTGSGDKKARLWDVQTGKQLRTLQGHADHVKSVAFSPDGKLVLMGRQDKTARLWDVQTGKQTLNFEGHIGPVKSVAFSPDGKLVLTGSQDKTARLWDVQTGKQIRNLQGHTDQVLSVAFSPNGQYVLTGSQDKTARLWDVQTGKDLCRLVSFSDGTWAVVDAQGRYDASNGGDVEGLHWVVGLEPIALNQLKERYYDPGLLAKHLGFHKEPLREVSALAEPKLYPEVQVTEPTKDNPKLTITLTNRGGGIGRVVVNLNGKEVTPDARPPGTDPSAATLKIELDLRGDARLKPGGRNLIEVQAFNAEGYLRSRGMERLFEAEGQQDKEPPQLWAVVAGVSHYAGPGLELRYAAKDAEDFAQALQVASIRLFGTDKVRLTLLTTSQTTAERQPTRVNLVHALAAAQKARPGDVLVIYLAGHGVNQGGQDGDFFYLTREATSAELKDPEVRRQTALSSAELTELLKKVPAQKQVLILDTCASGKALEKLTEKRDVPGSQVRALERVKDRTGLHILAGCAADAVSYEASRYGQGVLTYSLLLGMRGAKLREGEFVDVVDLFGYAADRVPELARDIGGVQRPVIASPRGSSFDIGRVTQGDQARIPLQKVRPLVLRASFFEEEDLTDVLALSKRVNEQMRTLSATATRGASLVFVDAQEFPDAFLVGGRYRVTKDKIEVTVRLRRGQDKGERFTVAGDKGKLDDLATRLVTEIEKRLAER